MCYRGAILEVLQSRLRTLSLVDLENAQYGSPEMYKKLDKLTHKMRHRFQSGHRLPQGLKLLTDWPSENVEHSNAGENSEPEVLDMVENDGEEEKDKIEAEENWKEMVTGSTGHGDRESEIENVSEHVVIHI